MNPLQFGTAAQFAVAREFLRSTGYFEPEVCSRLGLPDIAEYLNLPPRPLAARPIRDALDLLISVFLGGEVVEYKLLQSLVPREPLMAMRALGLIAGEASCHGTVALYPAYGVWLVSDRWSSPDDLEDFQDFEDLVYPAISRNTVQQMETLPFYPCEDFLELCAGSGVAAVVAAARGARHAVACDITARSRDFAEFNRLLNGLRNVTSLQGDLYGPVMGRTFDCIVANPPYMPSLQPAQIYACGGELGEDISSRIFRELPPYLRPGGRLYCHTAGVEREGEPYEQRVRRWIGDGHGEYDVALFVRRYWEPDELAMQSAVKAHGGTEDVVRWKALFQSHGVKHYCYGAVVVQRHESPRQPFTVRRQKGKRFGSSQMEWLLEWETQAVERGALKHVMEAKPKLAPAAQLNVRHAVQNDELVPVDFQLEIAEPFVVECKIQQWACLLLTRCDGKLTTREHFEFLKEHGVIHQDTEVEAFADFVETMIAGGYLEIEGHRPPVNRQPPGA